MKNSKLN